MQMRVSKIICLRRRHNVGCYAQRGPAKPSSSAMFLDPKARCTLTATFTTLVGSPTRCRNGMVKRPPC